MIATLLVTLLFGQAPAAEGAKVEEAFEAALVAAAHRFAEEGEITHLRAILDRHPKLVNRRQTFRRDRKPYWSDDYTALHRAAEKGHADVVEYLIKMGADVNATGPLDWTPLHVAAQKGDLAIVGRLVKAGAKVGAKTVAVPEMVAPGSAPENPQVSPAIPALTPLEVAREAKRAGVVKYLKSVR